MILKFLFSIFCLFLSFFFFFWLHCEACGILVSWWSEVLVHQSCPTLCDPTDYSLPGFSVSGILQARILEWIAIPFSRGSSQPREQTWVSCIAGRFFTVWTTGKTNQGSNPNPLHWKHRVFFFFFFTMIKVFTFIYLFIFISWRLITSQHFSGFCHTLTWIIHEVTCIPHPDPPSHFPLYPIPLGLPSAPGLSTCLMFPTWAGGLFHYR